MNSVLSKCLRFIVKKNIFLWLIFYYCFDVECLTAAHSIGSDFRRTESLLEDKVLIGIVHVLVRWVVHVAVDDGRVVGGEGGHLLNPSLL